MKVLYHEIDKIPANSPFSIIPLRGGLALGSGKRPAVPSWAAYQKRFPTQSELHLWFAVQAATAYGVICGLISHFIVLDLDDLHLIEDFRAHFPSLMQTFVVQTGGRGGLHLYFAVDFPVQTRKFLGADLKAEHSYVVGPGSIIAGRHWTIAHNPGFIHNITQEELQQIIDFLPQTRTLTSTESINRSVGVDYAALYGRRVAASQLRNQSLFEVGCRMRDDGYQLDEAVNLLAGLHTQQKPLNGHENENYETRYKEAQRTIASVYTRSARPYTLQQTGQGSALPNTIREALLPRDSGTACLRTIEALALKGVTPDQTFTRANAYDLLRGIVGRHSIDLALTMAGVDGTFLFERLVAGQGEYSAPPVPPHANADIDVNDIKSKVRLVGQKVHLSGGKTQRTEKYKNVAQKFVFPSVETLCSKLSVKRSPCDPLHIDEMRSASLYRRAYERELLKRKPGAYSQGLLAARLGVTTRSIRSYHRAEGIHSLARYAVKWIDWTTIAHVPWQSEFTDFNLEPGGCFLEDETGKRYKPFREIAMVLLAKKKRVLYKVQQTNYYWVGDPCAPPFASQIITWAASRVSDPKRYLENYLCERENAFAFHTQSKPAQKTRFSPELNTSQTIYHFMIVEDQTSDQPVMKLSSKTMKKAAPGRTPLSNAESEALAQTMYKQIRGLSLAKARILLETHGIDVLQPLFRRVVWLHQHGSVHSLKAYFMKSLDNIDAPRPAPKPRTYRRPLRDKSKECTAQSLHKSIKTINIYNARRLVELYGAHAVLTNLSRVQWLMQKGKAQNPAGLFIVTVRGAWRRIQSAGQGEPLIPTPRFRGERFVNQS